MNCISVQIHVGQSTTGPGKHTSISSPLRRRVGARCRKPLQGMPGSCVTQQTGIQILHQGKALGAQGDAASEWQSWSLVQIGLSQSPFSFLGTNCQYYGKFRLPWWCSGLRICLPMQGAQVRSLVQEDATCYKATKPVCHNY